MEIKTTYYRIVLLLIVLMFGLSNVNAQYSSQDELKNAAQTFFDQENYLEALPLYSQLLSLYPKDPNYNYKYGASYFFANREKETSLKYLRLAVTKPNVEPKAFYFLAINLHHNYLFSEAEMNYNKFKQKGIPKDVQDYQVDRKIEMCRNGATLLKSMTDIGVLVKKEIKVTDFFRSYDLRGIGGKIIVKPDEFKTKFDLKKNEYSIIHLGDNPTMVVFSSFGNDGKSGKDLYKVVKLPNGEWSKPTPFPKINTNFDEDYPFLHPDGKTLYFSSKGYNSMGGYDIFKSTLDPVTGEWGFPENLDFPINTPDDDILFISDIDNQLAYFASSRSSKQGELTVYKVKVDRQPAENTIVKGIFIAESNPNMKSATITIADAEKDRKYGVFTTNNDKGDYLLVFPGNGGKFKILVETTNDAPIHSAIIELPALDGFRALKQELRLVGEGNSQKLVVKNLFNESDEFDITDPLVVENLLKNKAKMDVNTTEEEALKNTNTTNTTTEEPTLSNLSNLSNEELVNKATKSSSTIAQNAKISRNQSEQAFSLAAKKSVEAKSLYNQYQQKVSLAKESQDLTEKTLAFKTSEELKYKVAKLVNEAIASLDLAKTLESEAVERESDISKSATLGEFVANQIKSGNRADAESAYLELEEIKNSTYNKESALDVEKKLLENKLADKELEYSKIRNTSIELTNRQTELTESIDAINDKIEKTSKKAEKEALQAEVNAMKVDLEDVKYDLGVVSSNEIKVDKELQELKNSYTTSIAAITSVINENNQTTSKTVDKTALDNDILFFEKQGLVGLYPTEEPILATTPNEKYNLQAHKDEFTIISDEGKIVDYSSKHSSELVDAQNNANEYQKSLAMAKVNQDWMVDINQELTIRENQLNVADNLNERTKLMDRIGVLKSLKIEKQKEADEFLLLASENKSTESNTTNTNKTENSTTNKSIESVNITDNEGNIVDYTSTYENQLSAIDNKESSPETIKEKIEIYEQWKNANEQELLLKKIELKSAQGEDKIAVVNRIEELENQLSSNKEYISLYSDKLVENNIVENNNLNTTSNTNSSVKLDYSNYDNKVISSNGEVLDYGTEYDIQFKQADKIVDPITSTKEKEKVINDWLGSLEEELKFKTDQLAVVTASEKTPIEERILSIKNEKSALTNQLDELRLAINQQQSLIALKNSASNSNTNNNSSVSESVDVTNSANKINSETPYLSNQAIKEYAVAENLTNEVLSLTKQIDEKTTLAYASKDETEKNQLLNEVSTLKTEKETKELELERVYEKSNKAEYYNNQEVISKVKQNANTENDNAILAELNTDEANTYFDKAQVERNKALSLTSSSTKEVAIQKAIVFEKTAIEKQRKAIELYGSSQLADNSSQSTDNSSQSSNPEKSVQALQPISNNSSSSTTIYQPSSISLPSDAEKFKAKSAENEAARLEKTAIVLQDSAENTSDKSVKNSLLAESTTAKEKAVQLRKDAEVSYAKATELAEKEDGIAIEINNNRNELSNEKITPEDEKLIGNLTSTQISEIKNSPEYIAYSKEIQDSRRLIKEAEVDYIQADKLNEEASNQKTLGISMNALAAGAQGEAKTKLLGQIKKLEEMIETSETKSSEYRTNATNKELTALDKAKKASSLLSFADNANAVKAVEKAETFNNSLLAETSVKNNSSNTNRIGEDEINYTEPIATVENNTVEENSQPSNNNIDDNKLETTNIQPELANTNTTETIHSTNPSNNIVSNKTTQPKLENKTVKTNSINNTNKTTLGTVDEFPEVLTDQIFVFTQNNSAAYSDSKKIPTAVKLPKGLVFKVQIGAFRNQIPQDHFRGFAPIMAEDAGGGITRYTAGLFKTFNIANEAKNAIRTIGYPDAFVVAFLNGKRININEARTMLNGEKITESNTSNSNTLNLANSNAETTNVALTNKIIPVAKTNVELVEDGVSTDVNKITGVFYTVQVGVYSKPITADQLNNVSPLNSERTTNGLIRYTSGVYPTLNDVNSAKQRIIELGITDAFVIAYANGNRVSITEATNFINENNGVIANPKNNTIIPTKNATINTNNTTEVDNNNNNTSSNVNSTNTNTENSALNNNVETPNISTVPNSTINQVEIGKELNIEFKVLLGQYTDEVPVEDAQVFLKLSKREGVKIEDTDGKTVYTIGSYPDYPSALDLQIEMKIEGVKSPKIIAFKDGSQIEVADALELVKNYNK